MNNVDQRLRYAARALQVWYIEPAQKGLLRIRDEPRFGLGLEKCLISALDRSSCNQFEVRGGLHTFRWRGLTTKTRFHAEK